MRDLEYWKQRCILAEKCLEACPSSPNLTEEQIKAYIEYNDFLKGVF